ncbi:MAG: hypothetical protein WD768_13440 [Phycisphaeraceae bacterium]
MDSTPARLEADRACFVISPIGEEKSPERLRSDEVFELIISPAAEGHGLKPFRADQMLTSGRQITSEVISQLLTARVVVADLTGPNANVFYELGIRHSAQLPVILLAEAGAPIPFNVHGLRVITYSLTGAETRKARESLRDQIEAVLEPDHRVYSPVETTVQLMKLSEGNDPTRGLLQTMNAQLESLQTTIQELRQNIMTPNQLQNALPAAYKDHVQSLLARYEREIDLLQSVRQAGIKGIFHRRQSALREFARSLDEEANEIMVIGSSLKGLLQQPEYKEIADKLRFKAKLPNFNVRLLLTHPIVADFRASQEKRNPTEIGSEILQSLRLLKSWGIPCSNVKLYLGTPTCFAMKTTRAMLVNPYPYIAVSFESPCLLVEQAPDLQSGVSGYFFEEFNSRHFGAWDTDMAVQIHNYDATIGHLEDSLPHFARSVGEIITKGRATH